MGKTRERLTEMLNIILSVANLIATTVNSVLAIITIRLHEKEEK